MQLEMSRQEAWGRFNDASEGYALLVELDDVPEGRLERAAELMDEWAKMLRLV